MKLSKRTNAIILWIISIGLLVSMVIAFTPSIGNLFANAGGDTSAPAILVNGEPITELEIARAEAQSPVFTAISEGQAAEDLDLLLLDSLIQQEVLAQASARIRPSSREVRDTVRAIREQNGLTDDQRYLSALRSQGLTDAAFRDLIERDLRQQQYLESLVEDVEVSDAEVQAFYQANRDNYMSEPRIRARMIVLEDQESVGDVYARLLSGEDFAAVAQEVSVERADQGGALGAPAGSSEPAPVGQAALPTAVANAAFGLQGPGLTMPVTAGSRSYIVQVESYIPAEPRPFEEVQDQVREDALAAKKQAVQQQHVQELREAASVTIPEGSSYSFDNPVVARVGDAEIRASELVQATYTNPQIQQFLTPDTASLVTSFFKPTILEQLIDRELAYQGAQQLDIELVGPKAMVAQSARSYVSRDAEVSEENVQNYYAANPTAFTVPARAVATRVDFATQEAAIQFRDALLQSDTYSEEALAAAAESAGGTVDPLGVVDTNELPTELDRALFGTDAFTSLPGSSWGVSDVLVVSEEVTPPTGTEEGGEPAAETQEDAPAAEGADAAQAEAEPAQPQTEETFVVMVAVRAPQQVRPLESVRAQVERIVLASERQELSEAWISGLREDITVENLLEEVSAEAGEDAPAEGAPDAAPQEAPAGEAATEETAQPTTEPADGTDNQ